MQPAHRSSKLEPDALVGRTPSLTLLVWRTLNLTLWFGHFGWEDAQPDALAGRTPSLTLWSEFGREDAKPDALVGRTPGPMLSTAGGLA